MSVSRLFILSLFMLVLSFCSSKRMESSSIQVPYQSSEEYSNTEKPYSFLVPRDGQMMRLEFRGNAPMNRWQTFDMAVYSADKKYLFNYKDELWSASGRDSDGAWTERKTYAHFDIRFPKKGEYLVFLSDETNSTSYKPKYRFRAVPIRGDSGAFWPLIILFGVVAVVCGLILYQRYEAEKENLGTFHSKPDLPLKKKSNSWIYWLVGSLGLWFVVYAHASDDDDDIDVNTYYYGYSHRYSNIYVDRSIRQQSLSGSNFRAGSSRGGK